MSKSSIQPSSSRRRLKIVAALLITVVGGVGWWYGFFAGGGNGSQKEVDATFTVVRGDFPVTIMLSGNLDAIKRHKLSCDIKGNDELKYEMVVDDRTAVKAGEVVAIFSKESFVEKRDELVLKLDGERKNLILAEQDLVLRRQTNEGNIRSAVDSLKTAREAKRKYEDLDAVSKRKTLQADIASAVEKRRTAVVEVSEAEATVQKAGRDSAAKLSAAQATLSKTRAALETMGKDLEKQQHDQRVFRQYEYPQTRRSLKEALFKAQLGLKRSLTETQGSLIKAEKSIQNYRLRITKAKDQIKELDEKIEKLVIKSPVEGIVAHGDPHRPRWRQPQEIRVGVTTRPRRTFASIPDLSTFVVNVDVPESQRSNMRPELKAILRSPAIPKLKMEGKVSEIAALATNVIHWDKNSPKVYGTKISTSAHDPKMMPGMTIEVEVIVEEVKGVLYVPVEALYNREGKVYCRLPELRGFQERELETGRSSISYVEVLGGLKEGEKVVLHGKAEDAGEDT